MHTMAVFYAWLQHKGSTSPFPTPSLHIHANCMCSPALSLRSHVAACQPLLLVLRTKAKWFIKVLFNLNSRPFWVFFFFSSGWGCLSVKSCWKPCCLFKIRVTCSPDPVWLNWSGVILQSDRSPLGFLVREHVWITGQLPGWVAWERQPIYVSLRLWCFSSLSPSLPLFLESIKEKHFFYMTNHVRVCVWTLYPTDTDILSLFHDILLIIVSLY